MDTVAKIISLSFTFVIGALFTTFLILKKTKTVPIIVSVSFSLLIAFQILTWWVSPDFSLATNISIGICILAIFITIFLYQNEIKVMLKKKKTNKIDTTSTSALSENSINEIAKAVENMSKTKTGALIVVVNGHLASDILKSGVEINADISSELLETIFFKNTPLHDGAVIIANNKIVKAGVIFANIKVDEQYAKFGSRHHAGIAITDERTLYPGEEYNKGIKSIIVSEETGIISKAFSDREQNTSLKRYLTEAQVRDFLLDNED
ncbi:MAG: DNA integrity scanning protein DisA nucleotide-binding domain protein [Clostridia bacterium]|nr:DNA integrity scanning protein DisA nucleotide-binding domain protein [Clostridia bacterium]